MSGARMHDGELRIDRGLVERLLESQCPQWSGLTLTPVASGGTDNALFRLGDDMVVRLPRIGWAVAQIDSEATWLPRLAAHLPCAVPQPLFRGQPGAGYPWPWLVGRWLLGSNPITGDIADPLVLAIDIAAFVSALHALDPGGGPPTGRGVPLTERDGPTRAAIDQLHGVVDTDAVTAAWDQDRAAPAWSGAPVWVHGDLSPGNLLCADGRLTAVIDFGPGVGDPACDLIVAWNLLPAEVRGAFRTALGVDDATWARGRGWALSVALIQLPYYLTTSPSIATNARHVIGEVLADHRSVG